MAQEVHVGKMGKAVYGIETPPTLLLGAGRRNH
jgi:hypothetical protein